METKFKLIEKELSKIGVAIDISTLRPFKSGGIASKLYTVESNKGKLTIRIPTLEEQLKQKIHEKIHYLSKLLENNQFASTRSILHGMLSKNKSFGVQRYIDGQALGDRVLEKNDFVNRYFFQNEDYLIELKKMLARLHEIKMKGYGFLVIKKGILQGEYKSWLEFLQKGSKIWLENIYSSSRKDKKPMRKEEYQEIRKKLDGFFERYQGLFSSFQGSLLHGDMINPGNVLIADGKIVAIVDFEWACSGDPPWEFAFMLQDDLADYYKYFEQQGVEINRSEFEMKRKLYRVLWLLWGANVHAKGGILKTLLMKEFKKNLDMFVAT